MRLRLVQLAAVGLIAAALPISPADPAGASGEPVAIFATYSPPPALSTSGDFATDMFSNPWDFSDQEDLVAVPMVDVVADPPVTIAGGLLSFPAKVGTEVRLVMEWPGVLPWGRDGRSNPIDGGRYTEVDFNIRADALVLGTVQFKNAAGQRGAIPFQVNGGGFQQIHIDLTDSSKLLTDFGAGTWSGPITEFKIVRGGAGSPINMQLDWVRLHRADASDTPVTGVPVPRVLTPNIEGGADYATTENANPWDFNGLDDVAALHQLGNVAFSNGSLTARSTGNDPFVQVPLAAPLNTDRYHRLTLDACYGGGFGLTGAPGGGMVGRMSWQIDGNPDFATTQDFVVFPGCHRMTIDLATQPASAVNDEASTLVTGWRGVRPSTFRFDLHEDPGARDISLSEIRLADDAAFATSYPISFNDASGTGGRADIYVTPVEGRYDGTRIATGVAMNGSDVVTYNWNGTDAAGNPMPNATYWVYVVATGAGGVGTGYSTGPVRLEKPVPAAPSYYMPLTPARVLDTRVGTGGNIFPLQTGVFTEVDVTGVGGVPDGGVTAVVMNVTATNTTSSGFITAWPSGTPQPLASNVNFLPGQTVPNLVTVKVGPNGKVNLFNSSGSTDVLADIAGYYTTTPPAGGGRFTAVTPSRLLDTRNGTGTGGSLAPVGPQSSIDLTVVGVGGVPATGVSAVALNVTVDQPTMSGFLTVWPRGETKPTASTHNFVPGLTTANLVLAKVGAGGQVSIYNLAGNTHVVADVVGYFSASGGAFVPLDPTRVIDSRDGTGTAAAPLGLGDSRTMVIADNTPVPANAKAVIVNVTSTNTTNPSFITLWPTGATQPLASTLNPRPGESIPNHAYLRLGTNGSLDVFNNNGRTDVIVDVFGYVM